MLNLEQSERDLLKTLGARLKAARKAQKATQSEFGDYIGITRQTYSKMENGDPNIDVGYWIKVSAVLDKLKAWDCVLAEKAVEVKSFQAPIAQACHY